MALVVLSYHYTLRMTQTDTRSLWILQWIVVRSFCVIFKSWTKKRTKSEEKTATKWNENDMNKIYTIIFYYTLEVVILGFTSWFWSECVGGCGKFLRIANRQSKCHYSYSRLSIGAQYQSRLKLMVNKCLLSPIRSNATPRFSWIRQYLQLGQIEVIIDDRVDWSHATCACFV